MNRYYYAETTAFNEMCNGQDYLTIVGLYTWSLSITVLGISKSFVRLLESILLNSLQYGFGYNIIDSMHCKDCLISRVDAAALNIIHVVHNEESSLMKPQYKIMGQQ